MKNLKKSYKMPNLDKPVWCENISIRTQEFDPVAPKAHQRPTNPVIRHLIARVYLKVKLVNNKMCTYVFQSVRARIQRV